MDFDFDIREGVAAALGSGPGLVAAREFTPDGELVPVDPLLCAMALVVIAAMAIAATYMRFIDFSPGCIGQ